MDNRFSKGLNYNLNEIKDFLTSRINKNYRLKEKIGSNSISFFYCVFANIVDSELENKKEFNKKMALDFISWLLNEQIDDENIMFTLDNYILDYMNNKKGIKTIYIPEIYYIIDKFYKFIDLDNMIGKSINLFIYYDEGLTIIIYGEIGYDQSEMSGTSISSLMDTDYYISHDFLYREETKNRGQEYEILVTDRYKKYYLREYFHNIQYYKNYTLLARIHRYQKIGI